ncbi:hypothetical protein ACJRO7_026909 [Eucalyptus globulus]|uniref:Uncharacterized protein n=1 Tax=Eucalyptus globulus TaxID=34317 RepID=A0ABD3JZR6_EUCGL
MEWGESWGLESKMEKKTRERYFAEPPRLYQLPSLPLVSSPSHMHTQPSTLLLLLVRRRTLQFPPFSFMRIPVLVDPSSSLSPSDCVALLQLDWGSALGEDDSHRFVPCD